VDHPEPDAVPGISRRSQEASGTALGRLAPPWGPWGPWGALGGALGPEPWAGRWAAIHDAQRILPNGSPSSGFVMKTVEYFDQVKFRNGIRSTITVDSVERVDEIAALSVHHQLRQGRFRWKRCFPGPGRRTHIGTSP